MTISKDKLESILKQNFPEARVIISDLVGDKNHYSLDITSSIFKDLSLIEQHRLVKRALSTALQNELHAVTIKTHDK